MENTKKADKKDISKIVDCIILVLLAAVIIFIIIFLYTSHQFAKNYDYSRAKEVTGTVIKCDLKGNTEKIKFPNGHVKKVDCCVHPVGDTVTMYTDAGVYEFIKEKLPTSVGQKVNSYYYIIAVILIMVDCILAGLKFTFDIIHPYEDDEIEDNEEAIP